MGYVPLKNIVWIENRLCLLVADRRFLFMLAPGITWMGIT